MRKIQSSCRVRCGTEWCEFPVLQKSANCCHVNPYCWNEQLLEFLSGSVQRTRDRYIPTCHVADIWPSLTLAIEQHDVTDESTWTVTNFLSEWITTRVKIASVFRIGLWRNMLSFASAIKLKKIFRDIGAPFKRLVKYPDTGSFDLKNFKAKRVTFSLGRPFLISEMKHFWI